MAATCILQVAKAAVTLPNPNNQPRSVALEQGGSNNAWVCSTKKWRRTQLDSAGESKTLERLLQHWWTCGPQYMGPSSILGFTQRIKLQGYRTSAKCKYKILAEFYYDAMQKVSDKCDKPPCQHLIDFTCNLICVINAQIWLCIFLPAWHYHGQKNYDGTVLNAIQSLWVRSGICSESNIKLIFSIWEWNGWIGAIGMLVLSHHFYSVCCMSYIQMIL